MKNKNIRGSSAVEAMIIIVMIAIPLLIVVQCTVSTSGVDRDVAADEARKWGVEMGYKVQGVSCARIDSNNDGYVSCALSIPKPDGTPNVLAIECARKLSFNDGCRIARIIPQQVNQ